MVAVGPEGDEMSAPQKKPERHIEREGHSWTVRYLLDGKPVPITSYHPWVFIEDGSILEGVKAWNFDLTGQYGVWDTVSVRVKPEDVSIEELAGYTKEQGETLPGVRIITVLHAVPGEGVICLLRPGHALVVAGEHEELFATIRERNEYLSIPPPDLTGGSSQEPPAPRSPKPKPLPPALLFGSNNVTGAAVRAFAAARDWPAKPIEGFAYGVTQDFKNLKITIGLPDGTQADSLWAFLSRGGAPMVKAHYALWGRWYEEGADPSGGELTVNVNQFCADLGYTPHHKGGYRTEQKQQAVHVLEALTAVEMRATFTKPGKKPGTEKAVRLRGPLWRRGLIAEENDRYADIFGHAREGAPNLWEPLAFSYAPGPWFTVAEWRKYNQAVGKIGAGLMRLDSRRDEWAVLIGGYLGTLMRTDQYATRRLRVGTILDATSLAQSPDARRRAAQYQEKFERALDRLAETGVIRSWTWPDVDAAELCDPDDPDAVVAYYADDNPFPKGDWRARIVEIAIPFEADANRLQKAQEKAVAAARTRQRRRETKAEESAAPE